MLYEEITLCIEKCRLLALDGQSQIKELDGQSYTLDSQNQVEC